MTGYDSTLNTVYNPDYDTNGNETPSGELPTTLMLVETRPVEPDGGPGGDVGPLYGNPLSHLFEDLSSWFPHSDDHGGGYPPFYAAPQASGDGPVNVPSYEEVPPGSNEPLDWG